MLKLSKYLSGKNKEISERFYSIVGSPNGIVLFLDYDGTLVPIQKIPSLAVLPKVTLDLLKYLNKKNNVKLVLVTGRSHSNIKSLLPIRNIMIISNHGFQISDKKVKWIHPELKRTIPLLKKIYILLEEELKNFPGVMVEDKKFTLTVHFRNAENRLVPVIRTIISEIIKKYSDKIILTKGKKIIEVRPNIDWNKGKAVLKVLTLILNQKSKPKIIYIGDDRTDEDAFRVLYNNAVTIRVGRSKCSYAEYYVDNPNEVQLFLDRINRLNSMRRK